MFNLVRTVTRIKIRKEIGKLVGNTEEAYNRSYAYKSSPFLEMPTYLLIRIPINSIIFTSNVVASNAPSDPTSTSLPKFLYHF